MKRGRKPLPPPRWGPMSSGFSTAVSEEEKAGRPVAPPIELVPAQPAAMTVPPMPVHHSPAPEPDRQEHVVAMSAAFARLSESERWAFERVFLQGFTYDDLAMSFGMTPAEARELTRTAARRVREFIAPTPAPAESGSAPPAGASA